MSKWQDIVRTVAPGIAGLLGGPLASTAVGALSEALLGKRDGSEEEVSIAVLGASPEILAKIKATEADLMARLAEAGVKLEDVMAKDRESARNREIVTKDSTTKILAYTFTIGYFGLAAGLAKWGLPADSREIMITLISILSGSMLAIMNYYFGTSKGSGDKTAILDRLVNHKN